MFYLPFIFVILGGIFMAYRQYKVSRLFHAMQRENQRAARAAMAPPPPPQYPQYAPAAIVQAPGPGATCKGCGTVMSVEAPFCKTCGGKMFALCASCGQKNDREARFCKGCGATL